jgi:lipoate-protein ligase B
MREEAAATHRHEEEVTASRQREEEAAAEKEQAERAKTSGASVKIEKVAVAASSLVVTIAISRGGTVTITGPGLHKTVRTLAASTHDVKVTFVDAGRAEDRHRDRIKVAVSLEPRSRKVSSSKEVRV